MSFLSDAVEKAIQNIHERRLKAGDMDADTWAANARELWKAANQGGNFRTSYSGRTESELAAALRENLYVFAAFKNHSFVKEMAALLVDDDGNLRPFDKFRQLALQVASDYNTAWLSAEYDTALSSAQMAVRWKDMQANKKALPYLKYVTAGDERVRRAHALLDGTVRHIDDAFWSEWFPPNGFRCRCDVQQVAGGETALPKIFPDEKSVPLAFRNNPGKSGQVFTLQHPYFQSVKPEQRRNLMRAVGSIIFNNYDDAQYLKTADRSVRALRQHPDALGHDAATGGFIIMDRHHSPSGIADEMPVLELLKAKGAMLELLDERSGTSGNDLYWDGHFWDIKRLRQANNLNSRLHKIFQKARRAGKLKVLLHVDMELEDTALADGLRNMLRQSPEIRLVNVVWNSGRSIRLTPDHIRNGKWPK